MGSREESVRSPKKALMTMDGFPQISPPAFWERKNGAQAVVRTVKVTWKEREKAFCCGEMKRGTGIQENKGPCGAKNLMNELYIQLATG